ncbi:MAG: hypothetical protein K9H49_14315 [Bacteroidales bacterium]|nr:hypothetical protein [Bacteroidales bacterium]MCF8405608.1 hypothetical protein [Bacteroidales bacterium]
MKNIFKKILREKNIQSLGTNVFVAAVNLATFLLLVRSLTKEEFGEWVVFITAATLLDLVRFGLTRRAIVHFISSGNKEFSDGFNGSGFTIDLLLSFIVAVLFIGIYFILPSTILGAYSYLFLYYPFLALANFGWNNAIAVQQSEQRFDRILIFRLLVFVPFLIFVAINKAFFHLGIEPIIIASISTNALASLVATIFKWNGWDLIRNSTSEVIKKILNYGKYTLLTSTGSSLLRSADALIIGMSAVLGPTGVAIYAIPFKIIDLIQMPLSAFMATAIPKLSKYYLQNAIDKFKITLYTYTGAVSILFIPVILLSIIFSKYLLFLFAGQDYADSYGQMLFIFYVVLLYGLILPFDRFTGVALDSSELPDKNALKVYVMLGLNLIGNIIAVFVFESLILVAVVSVLFTIAGCYIGWHFLNKKFKLEIRNIFSKGLQFYIDLFHSAINLKSELKAR